MRAALEGAPKIGESLCDDCRGAFRRRSARARRATASRTCSTRRSCAGSTTTRGRRSSSSGRTRTPTRRSAAADGTTGSSRRSAVRRRPASASAPGSSDCCSRSRTRESPLEPEPLDVFIVRRRGRGSRARCSPSLAELRRAGVSTDLDYAGRSFKGQMTQAGRTARATVAIVRADGATIRRDGSDARDGRSRTSWPIPSAPSDVARRNRQQADLRRRRPDGHARRLGRAPARPRRADLRRPERRGRARAARPQPGAHRRRLPPPHTSCETSSSSGREARSSGAAPRR